MQKNTVSLAHQRIIDASGIAPEVAEQRGYRTVTDAAELIALGFSPAQARQVPALLVPICGPTGDAPQLHQIRPDTPHFKGDGKPAPKYQTPKGARLCLDVPLAAREKLGDPATPLYITEGARKCDAAVSRGLCCIGVLGVWNWRGTNTKGGAAALGDWENVALKNRRVYVAFDSDVSHKPEVAKALRRLAAFLTSRGASVRVIYLLDGPNGEKTGLDDFFARGGTVEELHRFARDADEPTGQNRAATPEQIAATAEAITHGSTSRFPELPAESVPAPSLRSERGQPEYDARQLVELLYSKWHAAALTTEAAHGERVAHYMGADLRHCAQLGFVGWNERHWEADDKDATATIAAAARLSSIVRDEAAALFRCAATLATAGRSADAAAMSRSAAELLEHAQRTERRNFLAGALTFAAGALKIGVEAFEPKAWRIGFANGVWERGQWREHRRDDYLLHLCPVEIDLHADRSEWNAVLERKTGGDAHLARTLQDSAGYTLAGASHLRALLWAYGPKGTGKSTFAELLQTMLGAQATSVDTARLHESSDRERLGAVLWGKRLAVVAEAGNKRISAELLKTLAGGDTFPARFNYHEAFNAAPRHVLLLCANDAPKTDAYDDALRDRVIALPFVHPLAEGGALSLTGGARIEEVRRDPASPLVRGFAVWALEGLARVFETQTIYRAPAVTAATAQFWADADPLTPFWETVSTDELRAGIAKGVLRERYEEWCKSEGARPLNAREWPRACEAHGLQDEKRTGGVRFWFSPKVARVAQNGLFSTTPRETILSRKRFMANTPNHATHATLNEHLGAERAENEADDSIFDDEEPQINLYGQI